MPPVSWPTASIFCYCANWRSLSRSAYFRETTSGPAQGPRSVAARSVDRQSHRAAAKKGRTGPRAASPDQDRARGRIHVCCCRKETRLRNCRNCHGESVAFKFGRTMLRPKLCWSACQVFHRILADHRNGQRHCRFLAQVCASVGGGRYASRQFPHHRIGVQFHLHRPHVHERCRDGCRLFTCCDTRAIDHELSGKRRHPAAFRHGEG